MPDNLDLRLNRALEAAPNVRIPAGFAARTAALAPGPALAEIPAPRVGLWTLRIALAFLLIAMTVLARSAAPLSFELLLTAEFIVLAVWAGLNPSLLR